jgi:hypothetical protein
MYNTPEKDQTGEETVSACTLDMSLEKGLDATN